MEQDRYVHIDDHSDVASLARPRRAEVLLGPERRRKWSDDVKIAIVAEALEPDIVVSDVARRHDVTPSQLFGWIRPFRDEALARRTPPEAPMFAPAVVDVAPVVTPPASSPVPAEALAEIEISVGGATVRIRGAVDSKTLTAVLKALRVLL